jgi:hypothetical protein
LKPELKLAVKMAEGFEEVLRSAGLDDLDRVMALEAPAGAVTRAVPGRFTTRLELPLENSGGSRPGARPGSHLTVYLKRYRGPVRCRAAAHEWRMLGELAAAGIPCPRPLALGERRGLPGVSYLITLEIPGAIQADWWIRDHVGRRRELMREVGRLARQFHRAGFHHRDFYLCHFFVREVEDVGGGDPSPSPGQLELFLIDHQRSGRLRWRRRRWIVKDLAQLHHSLGAAGLGPEHWRELLDHYGPVDPALLRAVLRKSARIARHVPRYG